MDATAGKEKLVVEVVAAHNLIPKDGEGSSSPFVEIEFENQRLRTQVKYKDLNPIWNEKLVFNVKDVADLPYRTIEVNVFNEKRSSNSRNFLGKVRISGSSIAKEGAKMVQLHTLEKRSLFSHVRGEISLKLYVSVREEVKEVVDLGNGAVVSGSSGPRSASSKKSKKLQQQSPAIVQQQQQLTQETNKQTQQQGQNNAKPVEPNSGEIKHIVITTGPTPVAPGSGGGRVITTPGGVVGGGGGGVSLYTNMSSEFSLKETSPHLGGGLLNKDKSSATYDLVEQMQYLYVKVVKAKDITLFGGGEIVGEVKIGNYRGITKRVGSSNMEWDQVFAFSKDCMQSSMVEIFVKEGNKDDYLGRVSFDLSEIPRRVPPDSQLAPQWYRMEDKKGNKAKGGEVMVSIWFGTQVDEAFAEAWHSKAANVHFDGLCSTKSKVYLSPKLWYLRVSVIEAQDIVPWDNGSPMMRFPELFIKVLVGNQILRTKIAGPNPNRSMSSPYWNEDLLFVVADPFEEYLVISVEDRVGAGREETVGRVLLPITAVEKRNDEKQVDSRWFNLDNHLGSAVDSKIMTRFGSKVHLRVSLDGGYHVLDEATMYSSDVKATAKQLWKPHIGVLEMGILGASGLVPTKLKEGKGESANAYCVTKYGQKWVRTRTVVDSLSPKWNEQYTWEVFDPCTVITIGVFDNCHAEKNAVNNACDSRIGKVRIRLSTLESDRVYTHSYPLLMLHPTGVKKMGELHLASKCGDIRMRYDRLRSVAGRIQTVVGDMATQGERAQALLSWRDPRATFLFAVTCLFAAVGFYAVPIRVVVAFWGLYMLRPPRFRNRLPCRALNFFRRLPAKADSLL
ncbi:hypothetical protein GH714_025236 [Hevea brasiliensis]|uniref:C2 domain-containing protein n=1 Tax=Hevea brasiliensis TaxID=3981 RepID=A0A6A6M5D7_HEVBR|nr:hypothetical protein GH714_025236 [Hevea brasiliensis]